MFRSATLVSLLMLASLAHAAPPASDPGMLYRYTDAHGAVVLDSQVPAEFIGKGYEVLSPQGRVLQVIPPALSPEEMQKQSSARAAAKVQANADAQLMRLYSSVTDVDMAKGRKLAELDGLIGVAQGNLQALRSQQAVLQSQAADQERAGRDVDAHLLDQINSLKGDQQVQLDNIARYQQARQNAEQSFNSDRARVAQLRGGS